MVPINQYRNITFPWLTLRECGVEVLLIPVKENQCINPDAISSIVDKNIRILSTATDRFNTGVCANLELLSNIAHEKKCTIDGGWDSRRWCFSYEC